MTEAARVADELTRSIQGDPWHGDSVSTILSGVGSRTAAARAGGAHTIWEIVRHMTAWTREVARRLDGHTPGEPQDGDWPAPRGASEDDWTRDVQDLLDANRALVERLGRLSDDELTAPARDARDRAAGSGVSHYVLLHGLAQHHAYHAGQIAILKRIIGPPASASD